MYKAFPLLVRKFSLPKGTSHCLKKNATARRKVLPLSEVYTAIIIKEKPSVKMTVSYRLVPHVPPFILAVTVKCNIVYKDYLYYKRSPLALVVVAKIPVLDTGKFEQWQFRIQQYLQHEHYALWEVIEFGDSYKVLITTDPNNTTTRKDDEKSGRTVTITTKDMQRKKNDVKARTTLLLSLPDEHHGNTFLLAVAFFFRQWEVPFGSENFLTSSGNALYILFPTLTKQARSTLVKPRVTGPLGSIRLAQVESRLVEHKDREIKYCEKIRGLEYKTESSDDYIEILKKKLELIKKEKESLDGKLEGFETASKDLDSLLESQRLDKNKEGLGYSALPPPPAQIYSSPKKDMSWTGLPEFKDDTITDYTNDIPTTSKTDKAKKAKKYPVKKFSTVNRKFPTANKKFPTGGTKFHTVDMVKKGKAGSSQNNIDDKGYWDSDCSSHMTGNISYLFDFVPFDGGYMSFGQGRCKITGKGTIKTDLTCLVAKASADECMLWHRRLGHLNFKTMNKLVRHNLVRGLPIKCFENNHTCTACLKGKQHKTYCKSKLVNSVSKPLHTLHMDLFGPTSVSSISHKWYCLVVTDDFSRFTWTFFLKTKDETSGILRKFITEIKNLKDLKVKIIRSDNGGEFRNKEMNDFCSQKGSKESLAMLGLLSRMVLLKGEIGH
nr:putative ribonuclease H-like domain-containing protein [Tanacetum cinerariifolium]